MSKIGIIKYFSETAIFIFYLFFLGGGGGGGGGGGILSKSVAWQQQIFIKDDPVAFQKIFIKL